jgi:CRP/FNR family cyclic AMP-dependent transcriptional regulator
MPVTDFQQTMKRRARETPLFAGMEEEDVALLCAIATQRSLLPGEYLFLVGDEADRLFVVLDGSVELCVPLTVGDSVRDVCVETVAPGDPLGWSALVKPHRFTLAARASECGEFAAFARGELLSLLDRHPRLGYAVMRQVAQTLGLRLVKIQALWVRTLQRELSRGVEIPLHPAPGPGSWYHESHEHEKGRRKR